MADAHDVTTWIGVVATAVSAVAAVVSGYVRSRTKERLAAIDKGTPEAARIVANAVTSYHLNTQQLPPDQTFQIVRDEIAARDKKHARTFVFLLLLAIVLGIVTVTLVVLRSPRNGEEHAGSRTVNVGNRTVQASVTVITTPVALNSKELSQAALLSSYQLPRLEPPILDIKVVNGTDATQYFDGVRVVATRTSYEESSDRCDAMFGSPTGFYDVALDLAKANQSQRLAVSHVLKPGEADRFLISIVPQMTNESRFATFKVSTILEGLGNLRVSMAPVDISLGEIAGSCEGSSWQRSSPLWPTR